MSFQAVGSFTDPLGRTVYYDANGAQSLLPGQMVQQESEKNDILAKLVVELSPQKFTPAASDKWTPQQQESISSIWNDPNVAMQDKADWLRTNNVDAKALADILQSTGQANTTDVATLPQQIVMALANGDKNYKRGDYGTLLGIQDTYSTSAYKPQSTPDFLASLEKQNAANKAEWDRGVRPGPVSPDEAFKPVTAPSAFITKPETAAPVQAPTPAVSYASAPTIDQSRYTNYGGVQLPPGDVKQWAPAPTLNYGGDGTSGRQTAINALLGINAK